IKIGIIKEFSRNFSLGLDLKPAYKNRHIRMYKIKNGDSDSRIMVEFCGYYIGVFYIILDAVLIVIVGPEKPLARMNTGNGFFDMLSVVSSGIKKAKDFSFSPHCYKQLIIS